MPDRVHAPIARPAVPQACIDHGQAGSGSGGAPRPAREQLQGRPSLPAAPPLLRGRIPARGGACVPGTAAGRAGRRLQLGVWGRCAAQPKLPPCGAAHREHVALGRPGAVRCPYGSKQEPQYKAAQPTPLSVACSLHSKACSPEAGASCAARAAVCCYLDAGRQRQGLRIAAVPTGFTEPGTFALAMWLSRTHQCRTCSGAAVTPQPCPPA